MGCPAGQVIARRWAEWHSQARPLATPMTDTADLYETDFVRWAEQQARILREAAEAGFNLPLDWSNLAEEVDGLARSERRELRSRLATIIEHLVKLEHSRAARPREGWRSTIRRTRIEAEAVLEDNPSLRAEVAALIGRIAPKVAALVAADLAGRGEPSDAIVPAGVAYTEEQVLGEWLPDPGIDPKAP